MWLTEDQARTRWCFQLMRQKPPEGETATPAVDRCITRECMAWRVGADAVGTPLEQYGYCGLAGRPNEELVP
jgi:hypothetical protein